MPRNSPPGLASTAPVWGPQMWALVDKEFIAQHLQLVHAAAHPQVLNQNTVAALNNLQAAGLLPGRDYEAVTVWISGIESRTSSTCSIAALCSSSEVPGAASVRMTK